MSRGKAWNKQKVLETLKPYFLLGYSITKACNIAGFDPSLVYRWADKDEEIALKIKAWQNKVSAKAREVVVNAILHDQDDQIARWWLERVERTDFAKPNRVELTGQDGQPLQLQKVEVEIINKHETFDDDDGQPKDDTQD